MDGFLLDMDGVVYRGGAPIASGLRFLARLKRRRMPFLLLTNHSCLTPRGFSEKLSRMGVEIPAAQIYSSSDATAEWLKARKVRSVFAIGEEGLRAALRRNQIRSSHGAAGHVVVGLDRRIDYGRLLRACRLILAGAKFIGTNPDPTYPLEDGPAPECGTYLAAIQCATGQAPTIIGKPSRVIYQQAARRLGLPLHRVTMIGDRLDTDILGARNAGARSVLVLTGQTTRAMAARSPIRPGRIVRTLDELGLT